MRPMYSDPKKQAFHKSVHDGHLWDYESFLAGYDAAEERLADLASQPAVPPGMVLVPVEPTDERLNAANEAEKRHVINERRRGGDDMQLGWGAAYASMILAAAPSQAGAAQPPAQTQPVPHRGLMGCTAGTDEECKVERCGEKCPALKDAQIQADPVIRSSIPDAYDDAMRTGTGWFQNGVIRSMPLTASDERWLLGEIKGAAARAQTSAEQILRELLAVEAEHDAFPNPAHTPPDDVARANAAKWAAWSKRKVAAWKAARTFFGLQEGS